MADDTPHFQHPQSQTTSPAVGESTDSLSSVTSQVQANTTQIQALQNKRVNFNTDMIGAIQTVTSAPSAAPSVQSGVYSQVVIYNGNLYFYDFANQQWDVAGAVTSIVAGTGISISGATGAVTVTNSLPDQTVALSNGTAISVTGTYPNFTITNTSPGGTPGGSNTYVQYNNSSSFGGSSNFTFNGTTVAVYAITASEYLKLPVGTNLYP